MDGGCGTSILRCIKGLLYQVHFGGLRYKVMFKCQATRIALYLGREVMLIMDYMRLEKVLHNLVSPRMAALTYGKESVLDTLKFLI